ncbi:disease resistance TIR-NBS-LRR class family protein, partial [Tanacetum coccineum]
MGTEATRYLRINKYRGNSRILMNGLGKMKKLRYLEEYFANFDSESDCETDGECLDSDPKFDDTSQLDESTQYFPNSLKYLICTDYPFLYLPRTFQANNLVGLEMEFSRMVQLWEKGEKKQVLKKLKFLSISDSELTTFDFRITPNLEMLSLFNSPNLVELCMPASCQKLKCLYITHSKLRTFDLGLTPNLETLSLFDGTRFVKLHVSVACPNLKSLDLSFSRLRRLDLELIPNLESLNLQYSDDRCEPKVNCSLTLVGESLDLCPLHPNSNLPKFHFHCSYDENLPSSVGNIEKLISFGLCACTDFKKISDIICSLQCLQILKLECNIPEFPKDLGQLECLEELFLYSTKIKRLPDSICMLKRLKSLEVNNSDFLEKLPEDLGKLECLEKLNLPEDRHMSSSAKHIWVKRSVYRRTSRASAVVIPGTNAKTMGSVPLSTKKRICCVLNSPHVYKGERFHFEIKSRERLIDILHPTAQTIDSLMQLELHTAVDVEIKLDLKKKMHVTDKSKGKEKDNIYDDFEYAEVRVDGNNKIIAEEDVQEMLNMPRVYIAGAFVPATMIAVLYYFDHSAASQLAQQQEFKLKKPSSYHYYLLLLGFLTLLGGLLGVLPANGVIPQSPMHTKSLATLKHQ